MNKKHLTIASIFFVLSFIARLYFAGASAAKNVEMKDLFATKQQLEQEVSRLAYDQLKLTSLSVIQEKATSKGFIAANTPLLSLEIKISQPLASATLGQ